MCVKCEHHGILIDRSQVVVVVCDCDRDASKGRSTSQSEATVGKMGTPWTMGLQARGGGSFKSKCSAGAERLQRRGEEGDGESHGRRWPLVLWSRSRQEAGRYAREADKK